ncbi:hypothetical protein [Microbacterium sp. Marseille-Q6965]|uniref:hypothetical protein n=1 Tax=Microbacterium sp. Marseille-Q6965 TaxID=2965072 RepID=UPI0021B7DBAA|nr:hypothetical protein [Microbacterium sp. Marseille-Q6965]
MITLVVVAVLCAVASLRYAVMPVYPALPSPDYQLQATIAFVGAALALALGFGAALSAARVTAHRARIVAIGGASVLGVGLVASVAALMIP